MPAELFQILKDDAVKELHPMSANLENSPVATGPKRSVFIPDPKAISKNVQTIIQLGSFCMLVRLC